MSGRAMRYQREQSIVIFVLEDGGGAEKRGIRKWRRRETGSNL